MTDTFSKALSHTLGIEGGFTDDPKDSGGATNYGITESKARAWGYLGPMNQLPKELAVRIYRKDYWDALQLDRVAFLDERIAMEMFDTGVNCGVGVPVKFLQRALNIFNREGKDYPDLTVDGVIGQNTLSALGAFLTLRGRLGVDVMMTALNCLQGAFYTELAERRPKDEAFTFGWFANRVLDRSAP